MISAFGVEHGGEEIAKFDMAGIMKPLKAGFSATKNYGQGLKSGYTAGVKGKPKLPGSVVSSGGMKPATAGARMGQAISGNKAVVGGAAAGGAAVVGGTGYAMGNKKRY